MRPIANVTLHAILAVAIVALATSSAAAFSGEVFVKLPPGSSGGGKAEDIQVQSYQWGNSQVGRVSKIDGFTIKQGMSPAEGGEKGGTEDINIGVGELQEAAPSGGVRVASGDIDGDTSAASGLPTGKRQHKPMTVTKPLDKGTVWIRVASPWANCRVGARYPSITLADGAKSHVLQDVRVASCGDAAAGAPTEEVAFYYNRIAFNYAAKP